MKITESKIKPHSNPPSQSIPYKGSLFRVRQVRNNTTVSNITLPSNPMISQCINSHLAKKVT